MPLAANLVKDGQGIVRYAGVVRQYCFDEAKSKPQRDDGGCESSRRLAVDGSIIERKHGAWKGDFELVCGMKAGGRSNRSDYPIQRT